ncbi:MAG: NADH-quinone oxidoreductase subunit H [Candidatus Melainabacteria bacterium]|nr:NADH-quinone oxidoreductase subunit H [Candidatus Melainabacteria bacterium]
MSDANVHLLRSCAHWILFVSCVALVPPLCLGIIRKTKARLQNRVGPPLLQPLFDIFKLCRKGETLSSTMSGAFRISTVVVLATMLVLAWMTPWLSFKPWSPNADLFLIVYLFALARVFSLLGALDSGSAFGAFGASREVTLGLLVEPALLLGLVALGLFSGTSDLRLIFAYHQIQAPGASCIPGIWLLVGVSILLSSLVELSRMPVDDPTTHLELTMVHEAMVLEASGRNLALIEFSHALRMSIFFGLAAQCFVHAAAAVWRMNALTHGLLNIFGICLIAVSVGVLESLSVKLQWRKVPEFVAYVVSMSLLAAFVAAGSGVAKL